MQFHGTLTYHIKVKFGRVIGARPRSSRVTFRGNPIKGQGSSRGQSVLQITRGYQIWPEEPLTGQLHIVRVNSHTRVSRYQSGNKLLRNGLAVADWLCANFDQKNT